jgi:hypothetical protein
MAPNKVGLLDRINECRAEHPDWGHRKIGAALNVSRDAVRDAISAAARESGASATEGTEAQWGEKEATITSRSRRITTLEQLLEATKVDMTVWEVEKHVVNKWEMGSANKDGGTLIGIEIAPLIQIKVWLKRRTPKERAVESLLAKIEAGSPVLKSIVRPKRSQTTPRRSLEIATMDPHFGLVCREPEADGPWDLDVAAGMLAQAVDDLVEKAKVFGPFEEVVWPFGNDWSHCDGVFHTTTAGTGQPEAIDWHRAYLYGLEVAIKTVERLRQVAPVRIYQIPGNHSRQSDFTMALTMKAYFSKCSDVVVDASSRPYKFHRFGVNLTGFEHGHSVKPIRLAALMANECPKDWSETEYREWHLGDQHRKGSSKPSMLEEQGVSVEYIPGLTAPNSWHTLKSFSHQKRGAMAFVNDFHTGPVARFQFNVSQYTHKPL